MSEASLITAESNGAKGGIRLSLVPRVPSSHLMCHFIGNFRKCGVAQPRPVTGRRRQLVSFLVSCRDGFRGYFTPERRSTNEVFRPSVDMSPSFLLARERGLERANGGGLICSITDLYRPATVKGRRLPTVSPGWVWSLTIRRLNGPASSSLTSSAESWRTCVASDR